MPAEILPRRRNPVRPQHRGEARRTRLLAALADQLQSRSLADVSIATVADEAGCGRSAFYFYFTGKSEAVTFLLSDIFDIQIGEVDAVISGPGDPRQNLSRALDLVVTSWTSQRPLYLAMLDARDADPETRAHWEHWLRRYEDFVRTYIDRQRRYDGADSHVLAHSLISLNERVLERLLRAGGDAAAVRCAHAALVHIWSATIFGTHS